MFQTPVAIFIFNRPDCTRQLVDSLAVTRPINLFVIADGPRNENDFALCQQTRAIIDEIDWPCNIEKRYATVNVGCRESIPRGLHWVFEQVDSCIILEDDCIPQPSFFPFCEELLQLYQDDLRVMTIGGHRSDGPNEFDTSSYYFSKYPSVWGWATWKEKWGKFDLNMDSWDELKNSDWLSEILTSPKAVAYWSRIFDQMKNGMDAWDYALTFACWLHRGLSIRSKVNLISNVGFGKDSTHTHQVDLGDIYAKSSNIKLPLIHPTKVCIDESADDRIEWVSFSGMNERRLAKVRERINQSRSDEGS
jgi:hypothetical protein